jgi:hypothetical protein
VPVTGIDQRRSEGVIMDVVVLRSKADTAMQEIEGLYRRFVGVLSGAGLDETDGFICAIEPDSREAYLKINIDQLEDSVSHLVFAMKATQKRLIRDRKKLWK